MLTFAVIGAGRWGTNIIRILQSLPGVRVGYVCALSKEKLDAVPGDFHRLTEWRELLEKDLDGVLIATPAVTHAEIAGPFIEQGVPVFVEKPFTANLQEARHLTELHSKYQPVVFVGHIHLYNPAYQALKELVRQKRIKLIIGEGGNTGPFRNDVSAMWDWAPHDLSVMLDLIGEKPRGIQAWGFSLTRPGTNLYDVALLRLSFPSGISGLISISWLSLEKKKRITVIMEDDIILFDDTASKKITRHKNCFPKMEGESLILQTTDADYPEYSDGMPLTLELMAFIDDIKHKRKPKTDIDQGVLVVEILDGAERSIREGGREIFLFGS